MGRLSFRICRLTLVSAGWVACVKLSLWKLSRRKVTRGFSQTTANSYMTSRSSGGSSRRRHLGRLMAANVQSMASINVERRPDSPNSKACLEGLHQSANASSLARSDIIDGCEYKITSRRIVAKTRCHRKFPEHASDLLPQDRITRRYTWCIQLLE